MDRGAHCPLWWTTAHSVTKSQTRWARMHTSDLFCYSFHGYIPSFVFHTSTIHSNSIIKLGKLKVKLKKNKQKSHNTKIMHLYSCFMLLVPSLYININIDIYIYILFIKVYIFKNTLFLLILFYMYHLLYYKNIFLSKILYPNDPINWLSL